MSSPRLLSGLALVFLAAACGSRSSLTTAGSSAGATSSGAGGSGGDAVTTTTTTTTTRTTTTTTRGTGGAGGQGGAEQGGAGGTGIVCGAFASDLPVLAIGGGDGYRQLQPTLAFSSDDGERVTVAGEWVASGNPGPTPSELRHVSFFPWAAWPDGAIAPSFLADFDGGRSFAVARAAGNHFALLFAMVPDPAEPPSGIRFIPAMLPGDGSIGSSLVVDQQADTTLFLAEGTKGSLVGFQQPLANNRRHSSMGIGGPAPGGVFYDGAIPLGCASDDLSAGAVPYGDGWLVAASNGGAFGDAACTGFEGTPNEIRIVRVDPQGGVTPVVTVGNLEAVRRIVMVPRSDGAWVVWRQQGGPGTAPLAALRIDPASGSVLGPFDVVPAGQPAARFTAAALGDDLALAWAVGQQQNQNTVAVRLLDADGKTQAAIDVDAGGQLQSRLSLIGSPAGDSLVVAWSITQGQQDEQARLMRLDCIPTLR